MLDLLSRQSKSLSLNQLPLLIVDSDSIVVLSSLPTHCGSTSTSSLLFVSLVSKLSVVICGCQIESSSTSVQSDSRGCGLNLTFLPESNLHLHLHHLTNHLHTTILLRPLDQQRVTSNLSSLIPSYPPHLSLGRHLVKTMSFLTGAIRSAVAGTSVRAALLNNASRSAVAAPSMIQGEN